MKERPILFTGEMVRAILDGRKTQMRRLVSKQKYPHGTWATPDEVAAGYAHDTRAFMPPLGTIGDRLWVRETFSTMDRHPMRGDEVAYRADGESLVWEPWTPSIHMPRWASRIDLEITAVRVERVQDITEEDAKKEGITESEIGRLASRTLANCKGIQRAPVVLQFAELWQSIYGNRPTLPKNPESKRYHRVKRWLEKNPPTGWDVNPWVWVYEFRRIKP